MIQLTQALAAEHDQNRLKIDKLVLGLSLAHLPITMFLAPMGFGTSSFAIVASLIFAVIIVAGYFMLKGSRWFGVLAGAGFMVLSAILIQAQMGRIEMHFHIFMALAFMLLYRDWLTVVVPAAVIAVHHLLFTYLQMQGATLGSMPIVAFSNGCSWGITFLHAAFVVAESAVLIYFSISMRKEQDSNIAAALVINEVSQTGEYVARVDGAYRSPTNDALNSLLASLQQGIGQVSHTVAEFTKGNYQVRASGDFHGQIEQLVSGVNQMGERMEERRRENRDYASQIASINRSMLVLETDMKGTILSANEHLQKAFGYTSSELVGKHHRVLVDQATANSTGYQAMWEAFAQGKPFAGTMKSQSKSGKDVWLEASYNPVLDEQGKPYKLVQFATDITLSERTLMLERAIDESAGVLGAIASGDLSRRVSGVYEGRLMALATAVNTTSEKLAQVVTEVNQAAQVVAVDAEQVASGAQSLSSSVAQQTHALEQAASVMQHMNQVAKANTSQAQLAANKADQVRLQANEGSRVMSQTIEAMSAIRASSHQISDIVSLIDSIAFQTNLLALNAAVEAARAGEHGRGFAVVASEVRALAGKSADAARDIKALITDSVNRIEVGTELADRSGEVLNQIAAAVDEVTGIMKSLASASVEQAKGIDEVTHSVELIERVTSTNAAVVAETTQSAASMHHQVESLQQSMSFFQVSGSGFARVPKLK
ncbi:MAG: hypothetical protein B7Y29_04765 [Thiotrichales bacterium 16-46-22]|nr:MAG: hypothetical protein B7Y29_04765 [Thiotrichales bacterium 16-46-22]